MIVRTSRKLFGKKYKVKFSHSYITKLIPNGLRFKCKIRNQKSTGRNVGKVCAILGWGNPF